MAHWKHDPIKIQGPHTVEASRIEGLFVYPIQSQVDAVVANGRYVTSVSAAQAVVGNTGDDSATSSGSYSDKDRSRTYTVTVTRVGALGVAAVSWTTDKGDDEGGPIVVPVNGLVSIGTKGISLTFMAGAGGVLTLNNKWTVTGQREFETITALKQQVILRGTDFLSIATAAPDATQTTLLAVVAKKAYEVLSTQLGWSTGTQGGIKALDEL